jgi:hypothetical protein
MPESLRAAGVAVGRARREIADHRKDAPVVVGGLGESELLVDRRGVPGHGLLGDAQARSDAGVGAAFGHHREHLALIRTLTPVAASVTATATSTTIGATQAQVAKGRSVVTICLNAAGRKLIKHDHKGNPKSIPATVVVSATAPGYAPASAKVSARFTHRFPLATDSER